MKYPHILSQPRFEARRTAVKVGVASATFSALPLLSACSSSSDGEGEGTGGADEGTSTNNNINSNSTNTESLKIGATIPLTGAFADEGLEQQRGLELAVKHLNGEGDGGMLTTMQPSSLQGNGVLGRPVELYVADTETKSAVAEMAARKLISEQSPSVLVGGSSSGVAFSLMSVAQELGTIYMSGMAHSNDLTGNGRSTHLFRQYMNSRISSQALANTMVRDLGTERSAFYLTADYSWGEATGSHIAQATEQLGWQTIKTVPTPVGSGDYSTYLTEFENSGADVLILVHYGKDMINSVTQAKQRGIAQMQVNGNAVAMAVPVYTSLMAEGAGQNCAGVYGTINWHWSLQDEASVNFTSSYEAAYGTKPTEAAHVVYVQTMQYADAVERAGSLLSCDVIAQLEGHSYSGTGNGASEYRKADHQCFKDTLVAVGRDAPSSQSDILEIVNTVIAAETEYSSDDAEFAGELGVCNNG